MENNNINNAINIGRKRALEALDLRESVLRDRNELLSKHPKAVEYHNMKSTDYALISVPPSILRTVGFLIAEGDSWFDYPLHDVLKELDDDFGYDVESVAHYGDSIEEMAYGAGQLDGLIRRIEKLQERGIEPKAILLSGGGNDVAGKGFGMLLNHINSAIAGLNQEVVKGLVDDRIRTAYVTIISAITRVCEDKLKRKVPILVHGYDFPVPDGRGFLGGWWFLPGPWLEPGFREKGFDVLSERMKLAEDLIDRFNTMLNSVAALQIYQKHVYYVDLRGVLSRGHDYKDWWANELHPTGKGFKEVARRFDIILNNLP